MKTLMRLLLVAALVVPALAQENNVDVSSGSRQPRYLDWDDPEWWQRDWQRSERKFSIGSREFSVSGPLIDTFRQPRTRNPDRSRVQRFFSLPVVNLFVPQPIPTPSRQGQYFAWGEKNVPWATIAERRDNGPTPLLTANW